MVKHILVAVSNDANCAALRSAIKLARENDARISVIHVVDWMPRFVVAESQDIGAILNCLEAQGREIVAEVEQKLDESGCRGDVHMVTLSTQDFTVGKAIANFARKVDADMIVIGKAKSSWWRWFNEDISVEVRKPIATALYIASNVKRPVQPVAPSLAQLSV
jgi:nucleotide-binding universal stress UspA family protein